MINKRPPNLTFWALFFLLNFILFLPLYLVFRAESTFFPSYAAEIGDGSLRWHILKLLVIRQNGDLFRLSVEWTALIALWCWVPAVRTRRVGRLIVGFYLFALIYRTYDTMIFAVYNTYPNLYDDLLLLFAGIKGLTRHIGLSLPLYLLALVAVILFTLLCRWLIKQLLADRLITQLHWVTHLLLALMLLYSGLMTWRYAEFMGHPRIVASSLSAKVGQNFSQSWTTYRYQQLLVNMSDQLTKGYDYSPYRLESRPDIYLIFIESYGDTLYQFDELRRPYLTQIELLEESLAAAGWQAASVRSEAPIQGGKSWLSYTSFLFGLRVDNEAQYSVLVDRFNASRYPHLGETLKDQGYDFQRITPLTQDERDVADWEKIGRFFGYDQWYFLNDMTDFSGPVYGWGPSPPDQYTLSFLREVTEAADPDTPHLYFYITHNSHVPWVPPPPVAADWRRLAEPNPTQQGSIAYNPENETKAAYLRAIQYQTEMITRFILDDKSEDAIYVIVGDHQPPLLAFADYDGSATPLHIVTKNEALLQALTREGLVPGLQVGEASIKHEGFYSLFMRALLATYGGVEPDQLPPLRPDGLRIEQLTR